MFAWYQKRFFVSTGIGEVKVNPKTSLLYRTYEHNTASRQAQSNFNRQLRAFARTDEDPNQIIENYRRENERKFKSFNKAYRLIENMKTLGMDEREIRRAAKEFGFAGYKKIMRGMFDPLNIDPKIMAGISKAYRDRGQKFDRLGIQRELLRIRKEYMRKPLSAEGNLERAERPIFSFDSLRERIFEGEAQQPDQVSAVESSSATAAPGAAPVSLPDAAAPVQTSQAPSAGATISDPRTRDLFERLRG